MLEVVNFGLINSFELFYIVGQLKSCRYNYIKAHKAIIIFALTLSMHVDNVSFYLQFFAHNSLKSQVAYEVMRCSMISWAVLQIQPFSLIVYFSFLSLTCANITCLLCIFNLL